MKTEPTINIQDEVVKIHAQYGMTEMANYHIEKLFERYIEQFSPKIKQLEWEETDEDGDGIKGIEAITPFGNYEVYEKSDHDGYILWWFDPKPYVFDTEIEAKMYAQADFERRVMECLDLKAQQKQRLINMMRGDEEIGLYDDNPKNH